MKPPQLPEQPLWRPSPERIARSNMAAFAAAIRTRYGKNFPDYRALYAWSIAEPEQFWAEVWDFCEVIASARGEQVIPDGDRMPGATWFPQARLNFAENLLRLRGSSDAIVFWGEDKVRRRLSRHELYRAVARLAMALRAC